MKAIQTKYNGCLFRSRLEARWAIFLDALGIKWRYEIEGFDLDGEWYLPDFWLPFPFSEPHRDGAFGVQGYWLEIKPTMPGDREKRLLLTLARQTKHHAYLFYGDPHPGEFDACIATIQGVFSAAQIDKMRCDFNGNAEDAESLGLGPFSRYTKQCFPISFGLHGFFTNLLRKPNGDYGEGIDEEEKIINALRLARSARFEHGVTP